MYMPSFALVNMDNLDSRGSYMDTWDNGQQQAAFNCAPPP
jgi:hypothetical protein